MDSKLEKLNKLYDAIKNFQDLGLPLADIQNSIDELEEQIIKNDVLPVMSQNLEPMLSQIQRELVLVVEYKPGTPISVSLSRKKNVTNMLDAKKLELEPEVPFKVEKPYQSSNRNIAPATGLRVRLRNGDIIHEKSAKDTFVAAIVSAGVDKVRRLGLTLSGVDLISNSLDKNYGDRQVKVGNCLYVMTHSNTKDKKNRLEKISSMLCLGWRVEILG